MMLTPKQRWIMYSVALILTLVVVKWVSGTDQVVESSNVVGASVRSDTGLTAKNSIPPVQNDQALRGGPLHLEKLKRAPSPEPGADPLSARSWRQMEQEEIRRNSPPEPPPRPQAPPLQFVYMGKMIENAQTVVFLTQQNRNYVAREGEVLDGVYRVEKIGDNSMTLKYIPLKIDQTLSFAPELQAGRSTRPVRNRLSGEDED